MENILIPDFLQTLSAYVELAKTLLIKANTLSELLEAKQTAEIALNCAKLIAANEIQENCLQIIAQADSKAKSMPQLPWDNLKPKRNPT